MNMVDVPHELLLTEKASYMFEESSGTFDEGTPVSFLADGKDKIGGITYQRM